MARNEKTSARIAAIAQRALKDPDSVTLKEIQAMAGSVLTQVKDKKKAKRRAAKVCK